MSADQTSCETLGKFNDPQGSLSSFLNMLSAELRDYVENVIADIDDDYLLSALKVFYRFPSCKYDWFILPDSEPKGSKHHPPLAEGLLMADWEVLALREAEERHLPIWTEEELDRELFENIPNKHTKKFKKRIKSQPEVSFDEDDFTAELTDNEYREPTIEDLLKEESQTEDPLIIPLENPPENHPVVTLENHPVVTPENHPVVTLENHPVVTPENHPVVTDDSPTPQKRKPRAQLSLPASKFGIMRKFLKNESVSS